MIYTVLAIFSTMLLVSLLSRERGLVSVLTCCYFVFFFAVPGAFHLDSNIFPFYGISYSETSIHAALNVIVIFSFAYALGFVCAPFIVKSRLTSDREGVRFNGFVGVRAHRGDLLLSVIPISCIAVFGVDAFMQRRADIDRLLFLGGGANAELLLLVSRYSSFLVLLGALERVRWFRPSFGNWLWLIVAALQFLVINFPLSLPRFVFAAYGIIAGISLLKDGVKLKWGVFFAIAIGVTTLFPIFSHLSRGDVDGPVVAGAEYYRSSGDFDGLQSTVNSTLVVDVHGYQYGSQFVGGLLTFVPRSLWADKPLPSGELGGHIAGYDYYNLSMPLPAEIYLDFGLIGVFLLAFIFGLSVFAADVALFGSSERFGLVAKVSPYHAGLAVFAGFLMIILRGNFMAAMLHVYVLFSLFVFLFGVRSVSLRV